nr:DUF2062 domain-containing protein [uncultured Holophaga sp.]
MTQTSTPSPKPSVWARLKSHILHPELSTKRVAWSFAIGFSISWNPFLGLHVALAALLCLIFRKIHRPLLFLAIFINNPWTMVPMATSSVLLGNLLLGRGFCVRGRHVHWGEIGFHNFLSREGFHAALKMLEPILGAYILGGFVFSLIALPVGYFVMKRVAERLRLRHQRHLASLEADHPTDPSH